MSIVFLAMPMRNPRMPLYSIYNFVFLILSPYKLAFADRRIWLRNSGEGVGEIGVRNIFSVKTML